ncbi:MAG: oligosaccharide flippase family protein, partial [Desulfobacterales bacterium]|nr:oligosaccharide flippase family protein [Desulfobacterales bacterium]
KTNHIHTMKIPLDTQTFKIRLTRYFVKLKKSVFIRNILVVMSGTALAQAIGFSLSPIISRLFSPSDFGIYGSFFAVASIIAAGITLEYTQAIMLPKKLEDAFNLFFVSCLATAVIVILCIVLCLLTPSLIMNLIKLPQPWMLALLLFSILNSGLQQSFQAWCVRVKAFKLTSASQIVRSLSSNSSQIGAGLLKWGAMGLVYGALLAEIATSFSLARALISSLKTMRSKIQWLRMKQLAKEYRDFPMYAATANVINALSLGLPVLLLTQFYGLEVAGAYAFSLRILKAPMGLVLRALRQVLFQKACETDHHGSPLLPLYIKSTLGLFAIALIPSIALIIWSPRIYMMVFGSQWQLAGKFAQSLVLWLTFMFCNVPSGLFARILRLQRRLFIFDLAILAMRTLVLFLGGVYLSATKTIFIFSVVVAIMNLIYIVMNGIIGIIYRRRIAQTGKGIEHFDLKFFIGQDRADTRNDFQCLILSI